MIRTSCPRRISALLRPATTSPSPPVCASGVHSEEMKAMRRGWLVFPGRVGVAGVFARTATGAGVLAGAGLAAAAGIAS